MEKKNNEELLKVDNLDKNEYLVSSSIVDIPEDKKETKTSKVSVFTLIISAIAPKKDETKDNIAYAMRPVKTIKYLLFSLVFAVFVYACLKMVDSKIIIPLFLFFTSSFFPLLFICFHYELNLRRNVSIFQLLFSFAFGVVLYIAIKSLSDTLLVKSIYKETIDIFIVPVLWGVGESSYLAVTSKIYGITETLTNVLLAVCVGMGFAFMNSFSNLYGGLFRSVEIVDSELGKLTTIAIVDYPAYIENSISQAFKLVGWDCICFPFFLACWSVVMGTVASLTKFLGTRKNDSSFSVYLLLVLVIILYILTVFPTSIGYFEIFLKIICALISLFVALRLVNNAIYDTVNGQTAHLE